MTFGMKCCDYTCNGCGHEWTDTKQQGYEHMAYEISGCSECKSKDCSWKPHVREGGIEPFSGFNVHSLPKPSKEFVDQVLGRIKKHHSGHFNKSSINIDW